MDIVLILLFGSDGWAGAVMTLLYILGLWFMLKKSGLPGWWALVPFAREYMLSKCAGREAEGRVTSVVSLLIAATRVGMRLLASSPDGAESAAGAASITASPLTGSVRQLPLSSRAVNAVRRPASVSVTAARCSRARFCRVRLSSVSSA